MILAMACGLWAGGMGHDPRLTLQDHGQAGTPTAPVDLDAIEATQQAALEALRPNHKLTHDPAADRFADRGRQGDVESEGDPKTVDALLSTSYRSGLARHLEGLTRRTMPAQETWRFLPSGTQLYFFSAEAAADRAHLATLPPQVEAYCIAYSSIKEVIALRAVTGATCLIQPLGSDELPRRLGLHGYPALVTVEPDGSLSIQEGLR